MTRQGFEAILGRLIDGLFVNATTYHILTKGRRLQVYTLTERGSQEVTRAFGIDPDHIRTHIPAPLHIRHEMVVAECMRTLWREEDAGLYRVDFVYDQVSMTRMAKAKKGMPFPDLRIRILPRLKPPLLLNLEVDFDTHGRQEWMRRAKSWTTDLTLIVAVTEHRVAHIGRLVADTPVPWGLASFATWSAGGFALTRWWWPRQKAHAVLPIA